jgi:hypothetical protein
VQSRSRPDPVFSEAKGDLGAGPIAEQSPRVVNERSREREAPGGPNQSPLPNEKTTAKLEIKSGIETQKKFFEQPLCVVYPSGLKQRAHLGDD